MEAGASVGGAHGRRLTIPPSWSTAMSSGSPRVHAARCSSAVTASAVARVSQPLRRRTTPPILPFRIRARNLWFGGPTSVPITVSAVSLNPSVAAASELVRPGLATAVTAAAAATIAIAPRALLTRGRVALELPGRGPGLDSVHGSGARTPGRVRAAARSSPAADRRGRRGRARGARGVAREALDQARGEGLGATARHPHDRPDHARGSGHSGEGGGARLEGAPAGSV